MVGNFRSFTSLENCFTDLSIIFSRFEYFFTNLGVKLLKSPPGYWDLPELPEIGSPLSKSGIIAKSQKEFSERFKAKGCFFGVNGASGLIQSAVVAMAKPGCYLWRLGARRCDESYNIKREKRILESNNSIIILVIVRV